MFHLSNVDSLLLFILFLFQGETPNVTYADCIFQGTATADSTRRCWEKLIHEGVFSGISKIYRSGDNGPHFQNYQVVHWQTYFHELFGIEYEQSTLYLENTLRQCEAILRQCEVTLPQCEVTLPQCAQNEGPFFFCFHSLVKSVSYFYCPSLRFKHHCALRTS